MISKELLSLVLCKEVCGIFEEDDWLEDNEMIYNNYVGGVEDCNMVDGYINLDTLGRLCKEYCNQLPLKRYQIYSGITAFGGSAELYSGAIKQVAENFEASTELGAIIKATNWIANERGLL